MSVSASSLGMGLNVATKLAVKNSIEKIKIESGCDLVQLWGKIQGARNDYLIILAVKITDSITKSWYFSADNGLTFAQLPEVDDFVIEKSSLHRSFFTGNPSQIYKDPKPKKLNEDGEEEEEEEEEEPEPEEEDGEGGKPKERKLNELERLAFSVASIEDSTCIVPKGAFFLTPTSEIKSNASFSIPPAEISNISSYLLFRNPINKSTLARIRKSSATNNFDFLDPLGDGEPAGVWSMHTDADGLGVSIRSLVWPGYEAKFSANNTGGGVYFGTGLKNDDVLFMI
jgi:hypothetical protein